MDAEQLQSFLQQRTGRPVRLRLNRNRRSLVSATSCHRTGTIRASVHEVYLRAPDAVLTALAGFLVRPDEKNRAVIRKWAGDTPRKEAAARRPAAGTARGDVYELRAMADALNRAHFEDRLEFEIIWGRRTRSGRRQRQITLGTCRAEERLIRIHPILDCASVPHFYVEYVIYHEMCHLAVPYRACEKSGRRLHHTPEFYALERRFPRYREALEWQERNLNRMLSAWGREVPFVPVAPKRLLRNLGEQLRFF